MEWLFADNCFDNVLANLTSSEDILETQACDLRSLGYLTTDDVHKIYSVAAKNVKSTPFVPGRL